MSEILRKLLHVAISEEQTHTFMRKAVFVFLIISFLLNPVYLLLSLLAWYIAKQRWEVHRINIVCVGIAILASLLIIKSGINGLISSLLLLGEHGIPGGFFVLIPLRLLDCAAFIAIINNISGSPLEMDTDEYLVYKAEQKERSKHEIRRGQFDYPRCNLLCVGTTGSGKTTCMKNMISRSIENGESVVIFSAKKGTNDPQEYYHAIREACRRYGRKFVVVSTDPASDRVPYSPLRYLNTMEAADKLTVMAGFSESYYSQAYRDWMQTICETIKAENKELCPQNILALFDMADFKKHVTKAFKEGVYDEVTYREILQDLKSAEISQTSKSAIKSMVSGELGEMFGTGVEAISICDAVNEGDVILINLDAFSYEEMTKQIGQLAIMDLHHAIGNLNQETNRLSVYMDEAVSYFDPAIIQIIKQGRSNGCAITIGVQSFSDFAELPGNVKERVVENMNAFILMRQNEPNDAEYAANIIGTEYAAQTTSRIDGEEFPGMGSTKVVKEYKCHPDVFKELNSLESIYYKKDKDENGRMDPVLVKWEYYDPWEGYVDPEKIFSKFLSQNCIDFPNNE